MKKNIIICAVIFMAITARYGFAQQPQSYTEAGDSIEVDAGEDFIITLESNQTTGFRWRLAEPLDKNILELVNVEYVLGYARFQGAGGKEVWTFKAINPGKTKISLEYIRPWERDPVSMKDKTFAVVVKGTPKVQEESE